MSFNQPPPSLAEYPGYFPPAKPPFWTRAKVGVVSGLAGLMFGGAGAAAGDDTGSASDNDSKALSSITQVDVDEAVTEATDDLEQTLEAQEEEASAALAEEQQKLASFKKQAKQAKAKAVAKAAAAARAAERARLTAAEPDEPPAPAQLADTSNDTDPHFSYCYEANDAGYGPYREGVDPEYDWYDDRDDDGIVCES
jgi:Excalibur calcium-binding domain